MFRIIALALTLFSPRPDFNECVQYWQRQLALEDWNVTVRVVERAELDDATVGSIDTDARTKSAVIRVLREDDYDLPTRQARADQCLTIVHELVHLRRFARERDPNWQDEAGTVARTFTLLRKHRRWRELAVAEH